MVGNMAAHVKLGSNTIKSKSIDFLLYLWSGREDLNLRHPAPKAGALPGCATPRLLH
jgi:hypothetical protein